MGQFNASNRTSGFKMKSFFVALLLMASCYAEEDPEEYVAEENPDLAEGDMVLSPEQKELFKTGNLFSSARNLWPKKQYIYYYIERSLSRTRAVAVIKQAVDDYHKYTCLRFKPRTNQRTYLSFYKGGGCSSPIGAGRGARRISLATGCWRKGTVIHEMGHSIGLYHEQSRTDRDKYIEILWNNINPKMKFNFNKAEGTHSYNTPYDYDSVMHYPGKAFSRNGGYTIRTRSSSMQKRIGQRSGFSRTDIKQINAMYC